MSFFVTSDTVDTGDLGPGRNPDPPYASWRSSHDSDCGDLASTGGAGKLYCFVAP